MLKEDVEGTHLGGTGSEIRGATLSYRTLNFDKLSRLKNQISSKSDDKAPQCHRFEAAEA